MANTIVMTVTDSLTKGIDADKWTIDDSSAALNSLSNQLMALAGGNRVGILTVMYNPVKASGTVTFSGAATANDTVIINLITFTGVAGAPGANQFTIGATAAASAANLAAAINASVTAKISGTVTASSLLGVLTVEAVAYGTAGNAFTLTKGVDAGPVMTVSAATLLGGLAPVFTKTYQVS